MIILILFIQIVSLVIYFKILDIAADYEGDNSLGRYLWYFIAALHFFFILRFIYVEINFSYVWYDQIMEFLSIGISFLIVFPTFLYVLIKRNRKKNEKIK